MHWTGGMNMLPDMNCGGVQNIYFINKFSNFFIKYTCISFIFYMLESSHMHRKGVGKFQFFRNPFSGLVQCFNHFDCIFQFFPRINQETWEHHLLQDLLHSPALQILWNWLAANYICRRPWMKQLTVIIDEVCFTSVRSFACSFLHLFWSLDRVQSRIWSQWYLITHWHCHQPRRETWNC